MTAQPILLYSEATGPGLFLGPTETLLMEQLWVSGEQSARSLLRSLGASRRLAQTTVITILRRLCAKGLVTRRRQGRSFLFSPAIDRRTYLARQTELLKSCLSRCR